ncbi:unnamed protein product [Paramecium octaurelia]|uniref:Uncharacterized protein n=1 Tax=Paramecium octaurelia TaxID=43137 RepID=A0A8S1SGW2_PAROT|nr:unnamed protein product [Paramecium octaurelia]
MIKIVKTNYKPGLNVSHNRELSEVNIIDKNTILSQICIQ